MSEEAGFDVASAYVTVSPDLSDFQSAIDEEIGGVVATVRVLPDLSDFAAAIEDDGTTVTIPVSADTGQFTDQVDEAASGLSAVIGVRAETSEAQTQVRNLVDEIDSASGSMTIGADASTARQQAEAIAEEFSGITGTLSLGIDTGDAGEQAGAISGTVTQLAGDFGHLHDAADTADSSLTGAQQAIRGVQSAADAAAGAVHGLSASLAAGALAAGSMLGGLGGVAPVEVIPELSGFDSMLSEAVAGAEARVTVVPDTGNFAQQVDEETGGTTVSARLVPDASGFQEQVDEQLAGLTAEVTLTADVAPAEAGVREFASSAVPALGEVQAAAESAGAALAADADYWSQPRMLQGMPAGMQSSIDAFNGVGAAADEAASLIEDDFTALEDRAASLGGALSGLDAEFLRMANAAGASDDQIAGLTSIFENLYGELESAQAELAGLRAQLSETGGEFDGMDAGLGSVSSALGNFESNLAGTRASLDETAGSWYANEEAAQRLGVTLDELPAKMQAAASAYATGRTESERSLAVLNGEADSLGSIGASAADAAAPVGALGGVFEHLAGRLSYMAVDPFMWAFALPAVIPIVEDLGKAIGQAVDGGSALYDSMARQDDATGYNISGYQKLISQLTGTAGAELAAKDAASQVNGAFLETHLGIDEYAISVGKVQGAAGEAVSALGNLEGHLGTLESRYNLTASQAEALATAAGVSATQLAGSGTAAEQAMGKVEGYANANITAGSSLSGLSGDMNTFSNDTLTATSRVTALDDAYGLLVGNFVGAEQAQLAVAQNFQTIASNAQQAGASMNGTNSASITLQQSFYSTIQAVEQAANAMVQQGDSTQQVTTYIGDQITKLAGLTGGNAAAQQAVEGLKQWEDQLTSATGQADQAAQHAADTLANQFTDQVKRAGATSSAAKTLIDHLTTSILDTGTTSQQTAGLRARLIADLEHAGVNAKTATSDVDGFIGKIAQIPKSTNWRLTEQASGTWSVSQSQALLIKPGTAPPPGVAAPGLASGGHVRGGSGRPKADDIPSLLSDNEYVMQSDAVDHYGTGFMDAVNAKRFADGGLASYSGTASGLGSWTVSEYDATANAMAVQLEGDVSGAASSARAAAKASAGGNLHPTGSGASVQALMQSMAASVGWTGAEWDALNSVEMAEAGYNLSATNPGSGAYGLAQFIQGPSEYASYGGNSNTAAGQITAMLNYVKQRYGDPEAAWSHEQQFHWYKGGGTLNAGQSAVVGDGGLPEIVTAGRTGATVTPTAAGGDQVFNFNFYGTQYPSPEQIAALKMEFAFATVGAP